MTKPSERDIEKAESICAGAALVLAIDPENGLKALVESVAEALSAEREAAEEKAALECYKHSKAAADKVRASLPGKVEYVLRICLRAFENECWEEHAELAGDALADLRQWQQGSKGE